MHQKHNDKLDNMQQKHNVAYVTTDHNSKQLQNMYSRIHMFAPCASDPPQLCPALD